MKVRSIKNVHGVEYFPLLRPITLHSFIKAKRMAVREGWCNNPDYLKEFREHMQSTPIYRYKRQRK